jgi:hypothetical protein
MPEVGWRCTALSGDTGELVGVEAGHPRQSVPATFRPRSAKHMRVWNLSLRTRVTALILWSPIRVPFFVPNSVSNVIVVVADAPIRETGRLNPFGWRVAVGGQLGL